MAVRILIVEDNETVRNAVSWILRNAGQNWEICGFADSGDTAIEKAVE